MHVPFVQLRGTLGQLSARCLAWLSSGRDTPHASHGELRNGHFSSMCSASFSCLTSALQPNGQTTNLIADEKKHVLDGRRLGRLGGGRRRYLVLGPTLHQS